MTELDSGNNSDVGEDVDREVLTITNSNRGGQKSGSRSPSKHQGTGTGAQSGKSELQKQRDLQMVLEQSTLNSHGYFNSNIRKQRASKLMQYSSIRARSPKTAKIVEIETRIGGVPKNDQLVREGFYPKISEMIDELEAIAMNYLGFEKFLEMTKTQTLQDMKDIDDIMKGKKSVAELDDD